MHGLCMEWEIHMLKCFEKIDWKKTEFLQVAYYLEQPAIKVLSTRGCQEGYTSCTAAFLRAKSA